MSLLDRFRKTKLEEKKPVIKKEPAIKAAKKEKKEPKVIPAKKVTKKEFSEAYRILKKPLITERTTDLNTWHNQYVFAVVPEANKNEVKKAIQDLYGVRVERVNIINMPGKVRRLGRHEGFHPGYKKAIITLAEGEKIEEYTK